MLRVQLPLRPLVSLVSMTSDGLVSEPVADAGAVGQFVASGLAVRPAHRREHASGQAIRSFARRMARGRVPAPMKESMSSSLA